MKICLQTSRQVLKADVAMFEINQWKSKRRLYLVRCRSPIWMRVYDFFPQTCLRWVSRRARISSRTSTASVRRNSKLPAPSVHRSSSPLSASSSEVSATIYKLSWGKHRSLKTHRGKYVRKHRSRSSSEVIATLDNFVRGKIKMWRHFRAMYSKLCISSSLISWRSERNFVATPGTAWVCPIYLRQNKVHQSCFARHQCASSGAFVDFHPFSVE